MDDTAQNPQQQNQQAQQPVAQPNTTQPVVPQQPPVPPTGQSQVTPGGNPERAPVNVGLPSQEAATIDTAEAVTTATDDQAAVMDQIAEAADSQATEAADVKMQEAHPQVEVASELKDAGVEKGKDADAPHREEEQLQVADTAGVPDTQASASGISLASSPIQVEAAKKSSGIRDSLKWLASLIMYQWEKLQANDAQKAASEQKTVEAAAPSPSPATENTNEPVQQGK